MLHFGQDDTIQYILTLADRDALHTSIVGTLIRFMAKEGKTSCTVHRCTCTVVYETVPCHLL